MMQVIRYETTDLAKALMDQAGSQVLNCARFGVTAETQVSRRVVVASGANADDLEGAARRGDQLEDEHGRTVASLGPLGWEYRD